MNSFLTGVCTHPTHLVCLRHWCNLAASAFRAMSDWTFSLVVATLATQLKLDCYSKHARDSHRGLHVA